MLISPYTDDLLSNHAVVAPRKCKKSKKTSCIPFALVL